MKANILFSIRLGKFLGDFGAPRKFCVIWKIFAQVKAKYNILVAVQDSGIGGK